MSKAPHIYLDYNATAPVHPAAAEAAREAMANGANPSSVHAPGRKARALIEHARENVAALVGAEPSSVVFTGGGTEANALAILGAVQAGLAQRLIVSAIEHDSVLATAKLAAVRYGIALDIVRVRSDGRVDLEDLERLLSRPPSDPSGPAQPRRGDRILVSIMAANNETGVLQPLDDAVALARKHGALIHTDAVQIAARLSFDASPFDLVTLSAHKLGGIAGAGALIVRDGINLAPLYAGGRQENTRRPGTEPLAAITAFGAAVQAAVEDVALAATHARRRDEMEARLMRAVPGLRVFGAEAARLPQTSCIGLTGTLAETQVIALDLAGFAVSAGAACSSGKVRASHVLAAMGASEDEARCAIRVSFGHATHEAELHQFTDVWARQLARSRDVILRQAQDDVKNRDHVRDESVMVSLSNHDKQRIEA